MSPWVKAKYASELAVLSAWLAALIPWNVSYTDPLIGEGRLLYVRFPFFQVKYNFGLPIGKAIRIDHPVSAAQFQQGQGLELPYQVWAVGAAVLGLAVLLSFLYYFFEDRVEAGPVDPVRLMGAVIGLGGVTLGVATYYLYVQGFPGLQVPLGLLLIGALAAVLLTVDRSEGVGTGADPTDPEADLET